jgi:serine/threonine protein kinase/WD40 repeat protein
LVGRKLLHYEIVARLGEGGMGAVYKARDTHLDRFVALKFLPADMVADPERRARFVQEAKASSALRHPNIVTIYDIACEDGHDFIAMEYVAGKTLDQLIGRRGLKLNDAVRYGIQISDALAQAHAARIVHRDLKPSNIMVDEQGSVRVLDFGLAKLTETVPGDDTLTLTVQPKTEEGTIIGTLSYMSPEQAEGKPVDARSDVFSFGAVLYEMLCGHRAFAADSKASTLVSILTRDPPPLGCEIPPDLERIVARCLRKDPARRWQSMADVKVALEDVKEESESDSGRLAPAVRKGRRARWIAAAAALALAVAGWVLYRRPSIPAAIEAVPLTSYPGHQMLPSISPDGSQVAFTWCREFSSNGLDEFETGCSIYVKQIGVEESSPLSKPPDNAGFPQWSPDGAYIAFRRYFSHPHPRYQYVVVPQRGGKERVIAEFAAPVPLWVGYPSAAIAWTPDSKNLIVVGAETNDKNSRLYAVSFAGTGSRALVKAPEIVADRDPAISPDGRRLAFSRVTSETQSDLYVAPLNEGPVLAGNPVRLNNTREPANFGPVWMTDGRELLFCAGTFFDTVFFRIAPDRDATPQPLPLADARVSSPAISRQGRLIYTRTVEGDRDIFRITSGGKGDKWSPPERFISSTMLEMEPKFSPDGKEIAFASARSGSLQIWEVDADGANPTVLTPSDLKDAVRPRWSPDGRSIAFYASNGANVDVYTVGAAGGPVHRLTDQPGRDMNPEWSCDGKYVYVNSDREKVNERWKMPLAGGPPVRTTSESDTETHDCRYLIYGSGWPDHYAIWRKPLAGGQGELLADSVNATGGYEAFPDGIYYIGSKPTAKVYPILFRAATTGAVRQLGTVARPFFGFTVSPDRRTILYVDTQPGHSKLIMVEGFR